MKYQTPEKRNLQIQQMRAEVESALAQGKRIIFADEAVFTTATLPDRAYAARKDNVNLEEKLTSSPAMAVVAGVSGQNGLESLRSTSKRDQ